MAPTNRYLDGISLKSASGSGNHKTLLLWIVLILMFLAVYNVFTNASVPNASADPEPAAETQSSNTNWIGPGISVFFLVALGLFARRLNRTNPELAASEFALNAGQFDEARERLRTLANKNQQLRAHALFLLGCCAEASADFEEADAVFEAAHKLLAPRGKPGASAAHLVSLIDAHHAFVRIAAGRSSEGESLLGAGDAPGAHPSARALCIRARALLMAHRGEHDDLRALVDREFEPIQNALVVRDRLLLQALVATRNDESSSKLRASLDSTERRWIIAAAPHTSVVLVEAA